MYGYSDSNLHSNSQESCKKEDYKYICTSCGSKSNPKQIMKGSILIELVLWLFFLIPGLIYSIWRLTSKYKGCPNCKKDTVIPINSPMGQKLLKEIEA